MAITILLLYYIGTPISRFVIYLIIIYLYVVCTYIYRAFRDKCIKLQEVFLHIKCNEKISPHDHYRILNDNLRTFTGFNRDRFCIYSLEFSVCIFQHIGIGRTNGFFRRFLRKNRVGTYTPLKSSTETL